MIRTILSIAGKPGLYKLVSQGKNNLIVESLQNGKRFPAFARDRVMSLGDISIYTLEGDTPLAAVLDKVYAKTEGAKVDVKAIGTDADLRAWFGEVLPEFDQDRVYTTDIKKLVSWYNMLVDAGFTKFTADKAEKETAEEPAEEKTEE